MLIKLLSNYYGMTVQEFQRLINNDIDKLYRFMYDFVYNHN